MSLGRLLATALFVVACSPVGVGLTPGPAPTEDAAAAYLADVVRVVLTGDLDRLCDLGGGTCLRELDDGGDSVPHTAPRLLGSVVVPATARSDGTWNVGGRLLRLCGIDGLGRPYYSEMLVFEDEGRLISREPVFWTGIRIETGPMVTRTPEPAPCPGA